jgi:hypothetical protein
MTLVGEGMGARETDGASPHDRDTHYPISRRGAERGGATVVLFEPLIYSFVVKI